MNKDGYTDGDTVRSNVVRIYKGIDTIDSFASISASLSNSRAELARKLDKPTSGKYVLDTDLPSQFEELVKVGGRNLILNSDRTIEIKVRDTQWDFLTHSPSINLNDLNGTPVTVSFWAKSTGGNQRLYISLARDNYSKIFLTKPKSVIIPKEWAYFSFSVAEKSEAELNRVIYATGYTGGATDGMVWLKNIKLERGNVATDWTPAPEDMLSELSKYTTLKQYKTDRAEDSRKLDNKLDKPTSGKYVLDADIPKRFEELMKGRKTEWRNLLISDEEHPTEKEIATTDYLYRKLLLSRKHTFVIGDYYTLSMDVQVPNDAKGLDSYNIFDWNGRVNKYGGRGDTFTIHNGRNHITFKWGEAGNELSNTGLLLYRGFSYAENTNTTKYTIKTANFTLVKGKEGMETYTPAPEDLLAELDKYIPLKQYNKNREEDKKELTTAKSKLTTDISNARSRADSAYDGAQKANAKIADANSEIKRINNEVVNQGTQVDAQGTQINELKKNQLPEDVRKWLQRMGMLLIPDTEEQGSSVTFNGIRADHSIFLRFSDGKPSAMIGGSDAVLMAGVQGYGTDNLSARTEIYQDGSAKFGDVKLSDKTITLMPKSGLPLRVTAEEGSFIENFLANSKVDKNIAYEHSFVVVGRGEARTYSFNVDNNDTKLTITIPKLTSEVYQINQSVTLTLDGVTLGSWRGDTKLIKEDTSGIVGGGVHFRKENTPLVVEHLKFERYLNSGSHTLSVSVTSTDAKDKATITKLTAHLYYDASQAETILTQKGFRAFGGQNRYFDIDRSATYLAKGYFTRSNPYIARVKGGMRLDRLELEQPLDAPGCVLAGGRVENGYVKASFGKYKNQRGDGEPKAIFDNSDKIYGVFHSIGNTNYTPIVTSCAGAWGDVPQVIGVYANRFDVRFINYNNEPSVGWNFNYVCYKGD